MSRGQVAATTSLGVIVAGLALLAPVLTGGPAQGAVTCHKWVATTGADANAGTDAAPYRTLDKLLKSLQAGQTGCIKAGTTYWAGDGEGIAGGGNGTPAAPVRITSSDGGRATVKGSLRFDPDTHDVIVENLDFAGSYRNDGSPVIRNVHVLLFGDRITFRNNEVSNVNGIGVQIGNSNIANSSDDVVIENNRFRANGTNPGIVWTAGDSGAHGLYVQHTRDVVIRNNIFDDNRWRGMQFWGSITGVANDRAIVENNLFVGNATHINLGYDDPGTPNANETVNNALVRKNLFTARVKNFWPDDNPAQVFAVNKNPGTFGNVVKENFYDPTDTFTYGTPFAVEANNVSGTPQFENAAAGDYRLKAGSPGIGYGPASIQPGGAPSPDPSPDPDPVEGELSFVGATTDNYKNAEDLAGGVDFRTSLLFTGVEVGATSYVIPASVRALGSGGGAQVNDAGIKANGIPLATSVDGPVVARLKYVRTDADVSDDHNFKRSYYRIWTSGTFGPYQQTVGNRDQFLAGAYRMNIDFEVVDTAGNTLATSTWNYRVDPDLKAYAETRPNSTEHKGLYGRWYAGTGTAHPTPLNWARSLAVSTQPSGLHRGTIAVTAGQDQKLYVAATDLVGLPIPRWSEAVSLEWSPAGAGRPTSAPGTGWREITVNLPEGTHDLTASGICSGAAGGCTKNWTDEALQSVNAVVTAGEGDDGPEPLVIADQSVVEGTGADTTMTFTWDRLVHADVVITPGTADESDYAIVGDGHVGDLNETSIEIRIIGDAVPEDDETFTVTIEDYDTREVLGTATGTILDDDEETPGGPGTVLAHITDWSDFTDEDPNGGPAPGVCLYLYQTEDAPSASYGWCADDNGDVRIENVEPGVYYTFVTDPSGALFLPGPTPTYLVKSGVNDLGTYALEPVLEGNLAGTVTAAEDPGQALAGVCVYGYRPSAFAEPEPTAEVATCTGADGTYWMKASPVEYRLAFADTTGARPTRWWKSGVAGGVATHESSSIGVPLRNGTAVADMALELDTVGSMHGTVLDANGDPVQGACVYLYTTPSGPADYGTCTQPDGTFYLGGAWGGVAPGSSYRVVFADPSNRYVTQWWNTAGGTSAYDDAESVAVRRGQRTSGIDATLAAAP